MSKYKIIKKHHKHNGRECFFPMKRYFGFLWLSISDSRFGEFTLSEAEKVIANQKRLAEARKKKSEVVGYY